MVLSSEVNLCLISMRSFDETFNVEPVEVEVQKEDTNAKIEKIKSGQEDIRRDYEYTRGNLYSIIEKGQEAIDGILELAQESEIPRSL